MCGGFATYLRHLLLFCGQKRSKQEKTRVSYLTEKEAGKKNEIMVRAPAVRATCATYFFFAAKKEVSKKKTRVSYLTEKEAGKKNWSELGVRHTDVSRAYRRSGTGGTIGSGWVEIVTNVGMR